MRIEISVPNLPESVSDATLANWHLQPGDKVKANDNLVDLETDKVVLEVPAPESGILQEVLRKKGDVVASGDLLAIIETEAAPAATPAATVDAAAVAEAIPEVAAVKAETSEKSVVADSSTSHSEPLSPAVRRLLLEHELKASDIQAGGRINKEQVLDFVESKKRSHPVDSVEKAGSQSDMTGSGSKAPAGGERRVPLTRLRATIADRLLDAQRSTATLTTFNEVNLKKVFDLRNQYRTKFEQDHQVKLGFMSFFVKAVVESLKRYPILNASLDGRDIVYHDFYDIGIAVSTDRGLVVPVLRGADQLGFADIERAVVEFSKRARDGKLSFEELTGGTFTITNGGIFGSMLSTPILNPPQSAILGMHAIKDRPVVEDDEIVVRPMIYLAVSYDHRIIDGREAVSFLFNIKELLEDPVRMVLDV